MRELFSYRLTELTYRRAGLQRPADVKLKAEGWLLVLFGAMGLVFVVWGSTIYLTPRGMRWAGTAPTMMDGAWEEALQIVRLFERGERLKGVWRVLRGSSFS